MAKGPVNSENVIEAIDHRPLDVNADFPNDCKVKLNEVGSCATLVADIIRSSSTPASLSIYCGLMQLLHGAIILDTLNFSISANKARPLDVEIAAEIEQLLSFHQSERKKLFKELMKARKNVGTFNALQLLSKDLKIVTNRKNSCVVSIPGFPILVQVKLVVVCLYVWLKKIGTTLGHDFRLLPTEGANLPEKPHQKTTNKKVLFPGCGVQQNTNICVCD